MSTLSVYENCIELRDSHGYVYQLFSIANLAFAKQVGNAVCMTVQGQAPGVWTCTVVQLVVKPANVSVMDALNRARLGKRKPASPSKKPGDAV